MAPVALLVARPALRLFQITGQSEPSDRVAAHGGATGAGADTIRTCFSLGPESDYGSVIT